MSPPPRVVVRRSARRTRTVTAFRERDTIVVLVPLRLTPTEEQRYVDDLVAKVLAREARSSAPRSDDELLVRATALTARYLAPPVRLEPLRTVAWVTNQSRRWGSCTPETGAIRLSHRLQPMPVWVVDYVLLHELAHLAEPAHSARFAALVSAYPRAERARGYLEGYLAAQGVPAGSGGGTGDHGAVDEEGAGVSGSDVD